MDNGGENAECRTQNVEYNQRLNQDPSASYYIDSLFHLKKIKEICVLHPHHSLDPFYILHSTFFSDTNFPLLPPLPRLCYAQSQYAGGKPKAI